MLNRSRILLLLQKSSAFRAFKAVIRRLVKIKPGAGFGADEEQPFIRFLFVKPFFKFLCMLFLHACDKLLDSGLIECPITDIPPLLPVLFPDISREVMGV